MKKIVGTIAAIALAASSAFAGVGIGSWGRAIWAPVQGDGDKVTSWEGISWGGAKSRVGISVHGESENVGFNIDMNADGNSAGIGDTAYFWAKPWSWLELKVGKVQDDTGRGNGAYGIFNWKRMGLGWTGEDVTFTRFGNGAGGQANGAIVKVTPVDGLWIIAAMDVQDNQPAEKTYLDNAQYGAGYVIDGIGHIRAQYIGQSKKVNAAFDLTAVENLFVTVGAYVPVDGNGGAANVNAYANLKLDAVSLHALVTTSIASDFGFGVGIGADVDLGNGLGANFDVRYQETDLSFLAGLTKGLSNGMIGVGFQGNVGALDTSSSSFSWAVPVVIQAGF